jgi:hypothetical protein
MPALPPDDHHRKLTDTNILANQYRQGKDQLLLFQGLFEEKRQPNSALSSSGSAETALLQPHLVIL